MNVRPGSQMVYIIRGLPGSGKTTLANRMLKCMPDAAHFEADMFFTGPDGYKFDPAKLKEAHSWCEDMARTALKHGRHVIVSNTFSRRWEMEPYLKMADAMGCGAEVINCTGQYQNIHGVPAATIEKMRRRWEE